MTRREFTPATKRAARERAGGCCERCGAKGYMGWALEFDHIHATGLGGGNEVDNVMVLCRPCHAMKTNGTKATTAGSDKARIAKVKRLRGETKGRPKRQWPSRPFSGSRKFNGDVVWR